MFHTDHLFTLGLFGTEIGWSEILIVIIIGIIVFGKRLPEVGRSVGKSIVEFKKGLKGIEEELHNEMSDESSDEQGAAKNKNAHIEQVDDSKTLSSESSSTDALKVDSSATAQKH